ncbi:MAG: hypothetical protein GDA46_05705 [Bdellovibrionales bacterium]|nr:hypothetical protein [Bdellovibrionales bacterium]
MKKIYIKYLLSFFLLTSFSCHKSLACKDLNPETCSVLKDFQVFSQNTQIHFDHLCSNIEGEKAWTREAYVLFGPGHSAKILAQLSMGWVNLEEEEQGVALHFMEIEVTKASWKNTNLSFAFEANHLESGKMVRGEFHDQYYTYSEGVQIPKSYNLDSKGTIRWYDFIEPEEEKVKTNDHNYSSEFYLPMSQLLEKDGIYQLSVLIKNNQNQEEIRLIGPQINPFLLDIKEKPQVEVLGLFGTLNPFQRGGIWDLLFMAIPHDKCINARRKSRKIFKESY